MRYFPKFHPWLFSMVLPAVFLVGCTNGAETPPEDSAGENQQSQVISSSAVSSTSNVVPDVGLSSAALQSSSASVESSSSVAQAASEPAASSSSEAQDISSIPTQLDAQALYVAQCQECHGELGIGGPFTELYECETCSDQQVLFETIRDTMPYGETLLCGEECSEVLAEYIYNDFNTTPPVSSTPASASSSETAVSSSSVVAVSSAAQSSSSIVVSSSETAVSSAAESSSIASIPSIPDGQAEWVPCADEYRICSLPALADVRFYADSGETMRYNMSAQDFRCSRSFFGEDPAPGTAKKCEYRIVGAQVSSQEPSVSSSSSVVSSVASSISSAAPSSSSSVESSSSVSSVAQSTSSSVSSMSSATSTSSAQSSESSEVSLDEAWDLYAQQCAGCHGAEGDGVYSLTGECTRTDCKDIDALAHYIDESMPAGHPGDCVDDCAMGIAGLIVSEFQSNEAPKTVQAGSWNVDLDSCEIGIPGGSQRLLPEQLGNVISATFGRSIVPVPGYPAPLDGTAFSTGIAANVVSREDISIIAQSAEYVALELLDDYPELAGCGSGMTDSCAREYIGDLAEALYRGVYTSADVDDLRNLYTELRGGANALDANGALAGVVASMLQSPAFLYLQELGEENSAGVRVISNREIANRLAFLTTNSPPDAQLLRAAEDRLLQDPAERVRQAERLIGSSAENSYLPKFFQEWFGVDSDLSSHFGAPLASAAVEEFDRYIADLVADDQPISALFSGSGTSVNAELADFYGLSASVSGDNWVEVQSGNNSGVFSMAAVAAAHSNLGGTSIVKRGHWVRESLLCAELGTPPPGALEQNPELGDDATVRDMMDARGAMNVCGACHQQMDSIGIGMEDLNQDGLPRSFYELTGFEVDSEGHIADFVTNITSNTKEVVNFNGTNELAQLLASSPAIAMCARQQWFTYAMGTKEVSQCHSASIDMFGTPDSPRKMLLDLVASERFITRLDRDASTPMQLSE